MAKEVMKDYHTAESKAMPKIDDNRLTLFASHFCPFSRRVMLTLAAKNIDYDFVGISLVSKPQWYLKITATGKVPLLKQGQKILWESLVIVNYLDEISGPTFHPKDPYVKARGCLLLDELSGLGTAPIKALKASDFTRQKAQNEIVQAFNQFNQRISGRKEKFLQNNERPKYIDYMIWPFLEMYPAAFELVDDSGADGEEFISLKFQELSIYYNAMKEDPIVRKVSLSKDLHRDNLKLNVMQR